MCSFGLGVELRSAGAAALEGEETEPDMGDGCDLRTREGNTLQAALDQLEGGGHAVGVYSETRAVDLAAIDGHVRRRSAGFDCCHTVGVKSVCGAEIGGVIVIWMASKLLPVRDYAGRPRISAIIPGRLLHIRFQVQADNSEFDMLAAYMPAPSAGAARRAEISSCWRVLHETMLRLGDLVVLVGDLNAEPAGAGARRIKPALHRALGDGLLQGMMKDLNLKWLGSQRPTFFQAVDRVEGGAREAAGAGTMALALPSAVAPARRMEPSRWYERVGEAPPPTELADARAMVGRRLLVRVAVVGGCHDSGWCLAQVEAEHKRPGTRIAAVRGESRVRPNYDVRLLHDGSMCQMLLAAATYAGDADGPRAPSTHGATAAKYGWVGMWMLLEEIQSAARAAARKFADDGHVGGEDVDVASAARLEGLTRRSWWRAIDEAVVEADVLRAGIEEEAEAEAAEAMPLCLGVRGPALRNCVASRVV